MDFAAGAEVCGGVHAVSGGAHPVRARIGPGTDTLR